MVYSSLIGARVKRKEDPRLITGQGTYIANLKLPGMRYVTFVRSPHAHANILSIDTSAALKRPGVLAVVTGQDLMAYYEPMPVAGGDEKGRLHTHYGLSIERVRHVGEAVAAVIATSPEVADDALEDVIVDWEPLPAVGDLESALADGAPLVFDDLPNNIEHIAENKKGDIEAAFAQAARVVKQRMISQRLAAVPMEGRAVVAVPDPISGGLTMWNSNQAPHGLRAALAKRLRMPENAIRVIAPDVGGGFGVKIDLFPEDVVIAALAIRDQAPFKWIESRLENLLVTTHGRGQYADVEAAVQADGTVMGLRMRVVGDLGAYPPHSFIPELTGWMAVGVYQIPAVDFEATCVYTNTTSIAAYRGAGRPEAAYYIERMMDLIAQDLGLDPLEVRRKNFIAPDKFPYKTPTDQTYDSGEYERNLAKALEVARYHELRAEQSLRRAEGGDRLMGIGVACYVEVCGFGPYESANVRVEPGGTVTIYTGISPHGQGQGTTFAQIVADQIGADYDKVIVRYGDTDNTPMGIGTMGSRGLAVGGTALMRASAVVRDKARQIAAHILEAAVEDIVLDKGQYQVRGVPDRGLTLAQISKRAYSDNLPSEIMTGLEATDFFRPELIYPFGTHIAVVEIERDTGIVHLREFYSVDDCGVRISPLLVEGQVHGGLAQGIAQALLEEVVYSPDGQLMTGSLMDYAIPRADQFPHFVTDQTVTPTPHNPMGAKGIGEAATIGSTPAVVNAVMDALRPFGVRHIDMPLHAAKIWQAMAAVEARV
jgi:aerobic carbon-monoxide dehydrogenase large subunit